MKHEFKWEKDSIAEKFFREIDKLDEEEIVYQYVSFLRMLEEDIKKQISMQEKPSRIDMHSEHMIIKTVHITKGALNPIVDLTEYACSCGETWYE